MTSIHGALEILEKWGIVWCFATIASVTAAQAAKASTSGRKTARAGTTPRSKSARSSRVKASPPAEEVATTHSLGAEEWWASPDGRSRLLRGNCIDVMASMPEASVDVIFADPPYFLSNGGTTCQSGKRISVNKGKWDRSQGIADNHQFNRDWLAACQRVLAPNGTIWVSGTLHVIYSVGFAMQELGFKLLNDIIWEKPNPPPNLSCRYFTHSTETVLWAARDRKAKHHFEYAEMRQRNGNKQMKNVWRFTAPGKREKLHGKHPTQKPLELLERLLSASTSEGFRVLDPFNGSGTTGVAAAQLGLEYTGIELEQEFLELSRRRLEDARPEWQGKPGSADLGAVG